MTITHNSDGSYTLTTPITAADFDVLSAGQQTTTPPPVTTPPPTPTGFQGILAFNTNNSSALASNPYLIGGELGYYWSQLEPVQGQYNWSQIDNDMKPWVDNGKSVTLRAKTAGWTTWQPPYSQKGTPQYVLDQIKFVTDPDKAVKPQYWNPDFLSALQAFVQAFKARYDGHPNVLAVEIAVGDGGETKPSTNKQTSLSAWEGIGYSDAAWWNTIQQIIQIYVQAFQHTPLILMPNSSFIGNTSGYNEALVTQYAAKYNCWLQWNGLVSGAKLPGSFSGLKVPVVCEQLNASGANKRSLASDLQTAVNLGAVVALVFTSDLQDPTNAATLQKFAAMAS